MRNETDPTAIEWQVTPTDLGERIASIALKEARIYELNEKIGAIKQSYETRGRFSVDEYLEKIEPLLQEIYALVAQGDREIRELG